MQFPQPLLSPEHQSSTTHPPGDATAYLIASLSKMSTPTSIPPQAQQLKPLSLSQFSDLPFTTKQASPGSTQDEQLQFFQGLVDAISARFNLREPLRAVIHNDPGLEESPVRFNPGGSRESKRVPDEEQVARRTAEMGFQNRRNIPQNPMSKPPVSGLGAGFVATKPLSSPSYPSPHRDLDTQVPVVSLDKVLSQASRYLDTSSGSVNQSSLRPQVAKEIAVPAAKPESTSHTWESSDQALWKFPVAEGQPGMANPDGKAGPRLERLQVARLMNLMNGDSGPISALDLISLVPRMMMGEMIETCEQNEDLCCRCRELRLTPQSFFPKGPFSDDIPREWREPLVDFAFTDLTPNTTCPLCALMRQGLSNACRAQGVPAETINCSLAMTHFSVFWDNKDRFESFRFLTVIGKKPGSESREDEVSVDLVPVETKKFPLAFIGRKVAQDQISSGLVKRWLHQCEQLHGRNCTLTVNPGDSTIEDQLADFERQFDDLLPSMYFIDVQENSLTCLPRKPRYLALSYVWGGSKASFTLKHNLQDRLKRGSLLNIEDQLPAVIKDALTLTRDMEERYIWIDSLCIVQDDTVAKDLIIKKMNIVYGLATMTIIAGAGDNADAGLPGVRSGSRGTRQESATVATGLQLIIPHSLAALDRSTWASRAWT